MINRKLQLLLPLTAALLVGCSGGGGAESKAGPSPVSSTPKIAYTAPTQVTGSAPVVTLNSSLSSGSTIVFDVVGNSPATVVNGVVLNLQVDSAKLLPTTVPGDRGLEPRHLLTDPTAIPGGFGNGNAVSVRKDRTDGTALMATAIRRPSPTQPCQGVLLRFAYKVVGTPIQGVIRTQVLDGSGLTDGNGRLVPGTSPVVGRLEYL